MSSSGDCVEHFGQPVAEAAALAEGAVIAPIDSLVRFTATGSDRAKFLHNFCTNNINDLPRGHSCEAFFGNVQARVLGHGYLVSDTDHHELWMLPGDEEAMFKHLNKYIITEDVVIEASPKTTVLMLAGPETPSILTTVFETAFEPDRSVEPAGTRLLMATWNDLPTVFISCPVDEVSTIWKKISEAGATPTGMQIVERHRIQEGFPRAGVDLDDSNLIPEADRDKKAISYTKGCYLGQEPIARIDAMGHVNKKLMRLTLTEAGQVEKDETFPTVTSLSEIGGLPTVGLAVVPAKMLTSELKVQSSNGRVFTVETH